MSRRDLSTLLRSAIDRPVHQATGIPYSQEYWSVELAAEVADWFDSDGNLIED